MAALAEATASLPDRELRVLTRIATRLVTGVRTFGPLTPKKRVWKREAQEEALDAAVYLSCELEEHDD